MGYIKHHAIIVSSWQESAIKLAHEKAIEIFKDQVSNVIKSNVNSTDSFFIAPDGSKEGWEESNRGDIRRDLFIKWIQEQANEDESNCIDFVEVFFGEDNGEAKVIRHN